MNEYEITVVVQGLDLDDDAQMDGLYREDWSIGQAVSDGLQTITAVLPAASPASAVQALIEFLTPRVHVLRVDPDIVSVSEAAERLRVSRETVRLWATGQRGDGDFPMHQMVVGGQRMWPWVVIDTWGRVHERVKTDAPLPLPVAVVDQANVRLAPAQTHDGP